MNFLIGSKITHLDSIDSTNNYTANLLKNGLVSHGQLIVTQEQTSGRGQRGAEWHSSPGLNLTMSLFLKLDNLSVNHQFYLSKWTALVIFDYLKVIGIDATIKWPNDIYVKDTKIAGVLIESQLVKEQVKSVIIGIGLNVNQIDFGGLSATSIKKELQRHTSIDEVIFGLMQGFNRRWNSIQYQLWDEMNREYLNALYRFRQPHLYLIDGKQVVGEIVNVLENGKLNLKIEEEFQEFDIKEIAFI